MKFKCFKTDPFWCLTDPYRGSGRPKNIRIRIPEHWFLRMCRRCSRTWCSGCWPAAWRAASASAPPTEKTLNGTASSAVWTGRRSSSAGQNRRSARSSAPPTIRPTLTRSSRASPPSTPRWARRPVTALTKCLLASATAALPWCSDGFDPVSRTILHIKKHTLDKRYPCVCKWLLG